MPSFRQNICLLFLLFPIMSGCSLLLLHPSRESFTNARIRAADPRDVFFPSSDGVILHAWFLKAKEPKGTVLVFHGNAQNITSHANGVLWLVEEGFNVFLVDYRGYGISSGHASLSGIHQDGLAALDVALSLPGVDPTRIAVLGQSIGGSVAVYVAAASPHRDKIKLLVLDSSIYSYRSIAKEKLSEHVLTWMFQYPISLLFGEDYSPSTWIDKVEADVVLVSDLNDHVVPPDNSTKLFAKIRSPKETWITNQAGHTTSFTNGQMQKSLSSRLSKCLASPGEKE